MILLAQALGVIAAGVAIGVLWRHGRAIGPAVAVGMAAVVLATALAWSSAGRSFEQLDQMRRDAPDVDGFQAELHAGRAVGADVDFFSWAGERIPADATFAIVPPPPPAAYQWGTYQLLPRRHVATAAADYIVFYGVEPADASYDRAGFGAPESYGPGQGLVGRRHRAG